MAETITPEQFEEAQSEILSDVRPHLNQLSDSMECAESCETGADLLHNLTQAEESCAQALRALREVLRNLKGNTRRIER